MATTFAAPVMDSPATAPQAWMSFPISKMEKDARGNLIIKGVATDATVDHDKQIVDADWSAKALTEWLATGGNVRMSHDSKRPIGKGVQVELDRDGDGKHWVKSVIVDPLAIKLVEEGVLRAYSVGIIDPVIKRDPTGAAPGGIICGGTLAELSVVDRPANKNAYLELAKAAADGSAQLTGTMYANPDLVSAIGAFITESANDDIVEVSLPRSASVSVTPADLAMLLKSRGAAVATKRDMDPNVGGGTDRDKIPAGDFAGRDRSFPIVTPGDVSDAASSIGRAGSDNYSSEQLKDNIIRIARRKGPSFVAQLPDAWTEGGSSNKAMGAQDEVMDEAEAIAKGKKPFPGAAPPIDGTDSDGDGKDTDKPGSEEDDDGSEAKVKPGSSGKAADVPDDKDDDNSTYGNEGAAKPGDDGEEDAAGSTSATKAEGEAVAKGMKDCAKCGKEYHADSKLKRCESCNAKLPKANKGATVTAGRTKPTPADGVTGQSAAPVAPHREPDGPAIESFEADAKLPTERDSAYAKTVRRLKSLGVPEDMGAIHDLLCAAYEPTVADKSHPFTRLEALDTSAWQLKALDAAAGAPLSEAKKAAQLWQHSVTITETHPELMADLRAESFKAFADANMGPAKAPKPTEITATRFKRPLITAGHARPSFQHQGANTSPRAFEQISPNQFGRGPLTDGRAAVSPANKDEHAVEPPAMTGRPSRVFYSNAQRDNARSAMSALHDHIAQTFPDLCPMHGAEKSLNGNGGGTPSAPEAEQPEKISPETVVEAVHKGVMTLEDARRELGLDRDVPGVLVKGAEPVDAEMLKAIVAEAVAPLYEQLEVANKALEEQRKVNKALRKTVDAIAAQPEPVGPWRGEAVLRPTPVAGGVQKSAPMDAAEIAHQAQQALQRELEYQFNTSTDPTSREAAWSALSRMRGMR